MRRPPTRKVVRFALLGLVLAVIAGVAGSGYLLPPDEIREWIVGLPAEGLLLGLALLPLVGVPVTVIYLAVGARFGLGMGLGWVALATLFHLTVSYPLAVLARRPVAWLLSMGGWRMPAVRRQAAWSFALWLAIVPGLSYAVKNYIPPLTGVGFRVYLGTFFPAHVVSAMIGLMLGGMVAEFSWPLVGCAAAYGAVVVWLTRHMARRLRPPQQPAHRDAPRPEPI